MADTTPAGTGGAAAEPGSRPAVALEITVFTDPLCCWSWGFEPQLRRLRHGFAGRIAWQLRMGAMIPGWDRYEDPLNAVHRPSQMGPLWMQAARLTGMPMEAGVWVRDPPASSVPACLAVKAAELQSPRAADAMLRRLREAAMVEGRNIARREEILAAAKAAGDVVDAGRLAAEIDGRQAGAALEEDVREARFLGIGRFPCLRLRAPGREPMQLVGWRPFAALMEAVGAFAPDLGPARPPPDADGWRRYWGGATDREVEEIGPARDNGPPPPGAAASSAAAGDAG